MSLYEKCLIRPVGQIDLQAVMDEKANIDQIGATLGLKEMTQGTLIRKLCTYTQPNPTRRAIFEFDKLVRSIYILRYLRSPQLQRDIQALTEPDRVLSPTALGHCPGRRLEGTHRQNRHRNRDKQPVREANRERNHLLQLRHPVTAARQV